ncbi:MAG TPA: helix-turn-helix transcriptional regulator [Candidatus Methanoperedens sp.]|nr:helix-turn-helix transcriptional regulator [Candidatus Methanoperedens sp.]
MVYDTSLRIVYQNGKAGKFLERHALPEEISSLTKKIFRAIDAQKTADMFPGHLRFSREIGESTWVFRIAFHEGCQPLVCVYFSDETVSNRFDLNTLRQQYRLTRRETDVLRHLLDGKKNHEIAEELDLAEQTVKDYLSSIYGKFGVGDRFSLIRHLIDSIRPTLPK